MKLRLPCFQVLVISFLCLCGPVDAGRLNPVEKTIELLTKLQASIVQDGENEEAAYSKYKLWCKESLSTKAFELKTAEKDASKLEAKIEKASSDIEVSSVKIVELSKLISSNELKLRDATDVRNTAAEAFRATEKQLLEATDMLGGAIGILEKDMQGGASSLLQKTVDTQSLQNALLGLGAIIDAAGADGVDKQKLAALLESSQESEDGEDAFGALDAKAHQVNSRSIVEVMEDLRDKAEEQLHKGREAEANDQGNYKLLKQSLQDQTANDKEEMEHEKANKAASTGEKATAEGDLFVTRHAAKECGEALESTQRGCTEAAADHAATLSGRKEELAVLVQAKKMIQSTMGAAAQQTYSLMQMSSRTVSSRARGTAAADRRVKVWARRLEDRGAIELVSRLARKEHSTELAQLVSRLTAAVRYSAANGEDPFGKVKTLISDLLERLSSEASAEMQEKEYCDNEMAKTTERKDELSDETEGLQVKIDQSTAASTELKSQVKELQADLAHIEHLKDKMDKARQAGHQAYQQSKSDLREGLDGTRSAIRILRDYYASNDGDGDSAALLQSGEALSAAMRQPSPPDTFEKSSGAGAGIIGLLEVCESDIAKNLAELECEEDFAETSYQKMAQENKMMKELKLGDVEYKTREFKALDKAITGLSADFGTASQELEAVTEYFANVKVRCVAKPSPYAERKARREAEIQGLQEALAILGGPGTALLQSRRS